jgi:hypothetical protein
VPAVLGVGGKVVMLNTRSGQAVFQSAHKPVHITFDADGTAYYEIAPIGKSGVAFFGDQGKYVSNGRQRIVHIRDSSENLMVAVLFAAGEKSVRVFGYAKEKPDVSAASGSVGDLDYDKKTGRFSVDVMPASKVSNLEGDFTQGAIITFTTH